MTYNSIMSKALCEYKQIQGKEDTRTMKIKQLNDTIRETKSIKSIKAAMASLHVIANKSTQ